MKITPPEEEWFVVENTHEPIIEKSLFEQAQNLQKRDTRTAPSEKKVHLFSGFLRCPDCGMGMTRKCYRRQTKSGWKEYAYYICSTYAVKHRGKCTRHSMGIEDITEAVLRAIQAQIALVDGYDHPYQTSYCADKIETIRTVLQSETTRVRKNNSRHR
ncbi:recombinase zinc beta ribbon domain-containing protein [Lysinibacillus sp. FSL H8-0500]|uniref:recombinase zinc beta ribbon domain-containing protein n=1 Tax=Lysinibacillus TaxID=400634 RepID=UPI0006B4F5CB|nr:recombinase zinc beta ribbon domain-containing protein [Lysinibacillus macroides]QPR69784.1 recombinase zinc beta ribbon domain-containing protein [Lysinibacillus macroides]